jgi:hypothetical protein
MQCEISDGPALFSDRRLSGFDIAFFGLHRFSIQARPLSPMLIMCYTAAIKSVGASLLQKNFT